MRALLLIDVQNDFMPGGALAVPNGQSILPTVNRLLDEPFDLIVATKDWHPAGHGSFAVVHNKQVGEHIDLGGVDQILWPTHCVQNSWGADFAPGWAADRVEKVFYKGTDPTIDSYSAFFDNGRKRSTGLGEYLKEQGIDEVTVVGLATDYCVKFSVLDAAHLGFKTVVVKSGCCGIDLTPGDSDAAFDAMREAGAQIQQVS